MDTHMSSQVRVMFIKHCIKEIQYTAIQSLISRTRNGKPMGSARISLTRSLVSTLKRVFRYWIPIRKIRGPGDRFIFIMTITVLTTIYLTYMLIIKISTRHVTFSITTFHYCSGCDGWPHRFFHFRWRTSWHVWRHAVPFPLGRQWRSGLWTHCWGRSLPPGGGQPWWRHIKWKHFRVTGPLWGESTCHRWIPLTKASHEELWSFL